MKLSTWKAIGLAAVTALACIGCTDSGTSTGREADVFLDRANGEFYTIRVTRDSRNTTDGGSVSRDPSKANYTPGEKVTVTARANSGYEFDEWSSGTSASEKKINPVEIKMDTSKTLTAYFKPIPYTLNATASPSNGGSVRRNPSNSIYYYNDQVTLTAEQNPGYSFTRWTLTNTTTGVQTSSQQPSYTFAITGNITATAYFERIPYTLTVDRDPPSGGTVSHYPVNNVYYYGDQVTVNVSSTNIGYTFAGWTLKNTTTGAQTSSPQTSYTFTITGNMEATATFGDILYQLTLNASPAGYGSISRNPDRANYRHYDDVTITATPTSSCYRFTGWSDGSTTNPRTITITGDRALTANFEQLTYTLFVNANPTIGGDVSRYPNSPNYTCNESVTITATAYPGYTFTGWTLANTTTGAQTSSPQTSYTFPITGNMTATATFQQQYTVTFNRNGGTGTLPDAIYVNANSCINSLPNGNTLANGTYSFGGWIDPIEHVHAVNAQYCPTSSVTLSALWTSTVTFNANGGTGTVQARSVNIGLTTIIPNGSNLTRTGYNFAGWNTLPDGMGNIFNAGDEYTPTGNITLYAIWEEE